MPNFESVMQTPLYLLSWLVMFIALALTIVSMVDYIAKARHLIGFGPRKPEREPEAPAIEWERTLSGVRKRII